MEFQSLSQSVPRAGQVSHPVPLSALGHWVCNAHKLVCRARTLNVCDHMGVQPLLVSPQLTQGHHLTCAKPHRHSSDTGPQVPFQVKGEAERRVFRQRVLVSRI